MIVIMLVALFLLFHVGQSKECNVRDFGAKGDCISLDTSSINKALADPSCDTILLDHGCFLSGTVRLQSHKTLLIQSAAELRGAPQNIDAYDHPFPNPWSQYQDFGHNHWRNGLIWGANITDVRIAGGGSINGEKLYGGAPVPDGAGDKLIGIVSSSHITIDSLFLTNSGHFALLATDVDYLDLHDLLVRPTRDGFDIVSCRHVTVWNCDIQLGGDDALVFKSDFSLGRVIHSFDVRVYNCTVGTRGTTGLEIGSETVGDFYDYRFENCTVTSGGDAGIGMAIMDGARVHDVTYKNIRMMNVTSPFQLYIGARGSHPRDVGRVAGSIRDIVLEDIVAVRCFDNYRFRNWTASFDGQPIDLEHGVSEWHPVGPNILLRNVQLSNCAVGGGWPVSNPPVLPPHVWDRWFKIGPRPSWGVFLRDAIGIEFHRMALGFQAPDGRPAVMITQSTNIEFDELEATRNKNLTYDIGLWEGVSHVVVKDSPEIVVHNL